MSEPRPEALCVGHLCLDMIPKFFSGGSSIHEVLVPGKLVDIDGMTISTGGSANNTGQAMHRLGLGVRIVGKLGDDMIGKAILGNLKPLGQSVTRDMIISPGEGSSFTIILNPPGIDRVFIHAAATNATFVADELPESALDDVKVVHYGYPPLMAGFFANDGAETKKLFARARARGLTTSLDMARPDPGAPSGRVDWVRFLENVLPTVDLFLPSVDEIVYMFDRVLFDELLAKSHSANPAAFLDIDMIRGLADRLLAMGPALVGFKLGDQGFYLRTTSDPRRMGAIGPLTPKDVSAWTGREVAAPCFKVDVVGTTGSGDSTIAGFLASVLKGLSPDEAVIMAVGTGAESVEALDSASGVQPWDTIVRRVAAGWPQIESRVIPKNWKRTDKGTYHRP